MHTIARSALVRHSVEDMFSLVDDIESYPLFLPWCSASAVLARSEREVVAQVGIAFRGVRKSFTTRNRLLPGEKIEMELVDGPFSELSGIWAFTPLAQSPAQSRGGCRISLDLRFDFSNAVVGKIVGPVFARIADSLVDSFVQRADRLYGGGGRRSSSLSGESGQRESGMESRVPSSIILEVVYALPARQVVERVELPPPVTIEQAIRASSILRRFPEIDLARTPVGVFGSERPLDWPLAHGDRVEIYRPLQMSPVEARRRRTDVG